MCYKCVCVCCAHFYSRQRKLSYFSVIAVAGVQCCSDTIHSQNISIGVTSTLSQRGRKQKLIHGFCRFLHPFFSLSLSILSSFAAERASILESAYYFHVARVRHKMTKEVPHNEATTHTQHAIYCGIKEHSLVKTHTQHHIMLASENPTMAFHSISQMMAWRKRERESEGKIEDEAWNLRIPSIDVVNNKENSILLEERNDIL